MPFSRDAPELDAVAANVVIEFIRHEYAKHFQNFLINTGKSEEDWKKTVSISHKDFLKLQEAVYRILGKNDPWAFVEVGKYLTKTENPAVSVARRLGSTAAVVALAGMKSNPKLNMDSMIRPLSVVVEENLGRALIAHDNLGFVDLKYLTAPTTSAGYLRGIPDLWGFDPMNVQVRMVDQKLEDIIRREFGEVRIELTKDNDGNYIDSRGRIVAAKVTLPETPFTNIEIPHKTYRIKTGEHNGRLFVGDPGRFLKLAKGDYEEVDFANEPLLQTCEDIFGTDRNGNQVLIAPRGIYFGGPFSVYEMDWKERKLNWLSRMVVNISEWWRSGSSRDVMHEIARREAVERAKVKTEAETAVQTFLAEVGRLTAREQAILDAEETFRDTMRVEAHDLANKFMRIRNEMHSGLVSLLCSSIEELSDEERRNVFEIFSRDYLIIEGDLENSRPAITETDSISERFRLGIGLDSKSPVPKEALVAKDINGLLDICYEIFNLRTRKMIDDYRSSMETPRASCNEGNDYSRNLMGRISNEALSQEDIKDIWDSEVKGLERALYGIEYNIDLEAHQIEVDRRRIELAIRNLMANAIDASLSTDNRYIRITGKNNRRSYDIEMVNSCRWESEKIRDEVVEAANSFDRVRSTKEGENRGGGTRYIRSFFRNLGGNYRVSAESDQFKQEIKISI